MTEPGTARRFERAVVTGGAGFVGAHLCALLLAEGLEVIAVDNLVTAAPGSLDALRRDGRFRFARHDVTQPFTVDDRADVVFHLACPASPRDYLALPIETLRAGALGTEHALGLARRDGARFVLASTSEVYGDPLEHPQRESYWGNVNPIGPRSVYDEGKRYAEALTSAYRREHGVDTAIARIFNTYGPGMRAGDGRMIPAFLRQALAEEPLTVTGTGNQTRSICYVEDTVAGLLALARSAHPGPVNLGNPHELTVRQVAERIRALTGSASPIEFVDAMTDDPQRRCPDISLARDVLGWEPKIGADDGLRRTAVWFRRSPSR
ncbi:UDP-glucuronic acid decarboxylase family protein [Amycolatopsis sp., V23-08]|uniref:UDP-glucuronic acid decarboxylase family protein n=1 Tax=Amycolatopsis heterodermiae TaxID=3110235 RepID=A0ABU5R486_9PSEU|nr:UDP-glucuronic acid decarboxylase family protein [Amycolatopsis sp., V23-08]MEA5361017.1 UDP-glucuronic acid decarboxylase family protein [Amycolatopsis sp., V23-08]